MLVFWTRTRVNEPHPASNCCRRSFVMAKSRDLAPLLRLLSSRYMAQDYSAQLPAAGECTSQISEFAPVCTYTTTNAVMLETFHPGARFRITFRRFCVTGQSKQNASSAFPPQKHYESLGPIKAFLCCGLCLEFCNVLSSYNKRGAKENI